MDQTAGKNDNYAESIEQKKRKAADDSPSSDSESMKKKRPNVENEEHAAEEDETAVANKPAELEEEDNSYNLSSDDEEDEDEEDEAEEKDKAVGFAEDNTDLSNRTSHPGQELDMMMQKERRDENDENRLLVFETIEKAKTSLESKLDDSKISTSLSDSSSKEALRRKKQEQTEEESKKMQVLMANFSEEQLNRYEFFRRSAFQKSTVKKIIQTVCGKSVSQSVVIAMSGIAKVFVGEIVEKALDVKQKWSDEGPLQPKHLREAFRLFKNTNKLAYSSKYKRDSIF